MPMLIKWGQHLNTWCVHSCSCPSSLASVSVVPSKPHTRIIIFPIDYVLSCKGNIMWLDRMITDTLINWLFPFEEPFPVISFLRTWCSIFYFVKIACWEWKTAFVVVIIIQSPSCVQFFMTPWTSACQASLYFTISQSLLKFTSTELVMPSNHLILCHPFLLLSSVFPSIKVFSNESALRIRWPKYWSFSFSISPSNEYSG